MNPIPTPKERAEDLRAFARLYHDEIRDSEYTTLVEAANLLDTMENA